MKTFINVLYRRILYKIPLKLLLVLLAVFSVLFACFSKSEFTCVPAFIGNYPGVSYNQTISLGVDGNFGVDTWCVVSSFGSFDYDISCDGVRDGRLEYQNGKCFDMSEVVGNFCLTSLQSNSQVGYYYVDSSCQTQPFTSMQCQTLYNLIPISSVDQNYCTTNNLCPSQECPDTGTGNLTQLYINNILHVGAPTILMNIPDEIDWDYAYTMGGNIMNIDVVGYNVDYQVVEDEITIQKYKPSTDELSGIISGLIPLFVPGLCIILLLYFIFKFIKKVF